MKTVVRNSYTPKIGDYCETIVVDKETKNAYIFDRDGIFTPMPQPVDVEDILRRAAEYTDETVAPINEKLDTIEEGAQVNVIETVMKNGTPLTVTNKTVNVTVPTKTSDLENDGSDGTDTYVESAALDDYYTKTETDTQIGYETDAREIADSGLQEQIDAIVASSDVVDIVGTYAALQAYDTSKLSDNDIIKVLTDETRDDATTYYRWTNSTWTYIGAEGPFYTKAETDAIFTPMSRTINGKGLSSDITLTAQDVGALPDSTVIPTVNDATLTIQKNGTTVGTFTANSASNQTANITVPVDTSDLNNDGDGQSPFATEDYVDLNGGKIDTIEVNGTEQPIVDKTVDIAVPTKTSDLENDGSDGTDTYVEAGDLATVATSGDYDDLTNKPTIPTVNDATLTIQKNGTDVAAFTANSASAVTANITVPTDTADLTNGAGFITTAALSNYYTKGETYSQQEVNSLINTLSIPTKTSDLTNDGSDGTSTYVEADDLATVATSGSYNDLSNKPTIPTIVDMTGATASTAGAHGYVPAPAAGDQNKFLQGDGTWATPADEIYTAGNGINIDADNEISVDTSVVATQTDLAGKQDTLTAGSNMDITDNVISAKVDSALSVSSTNPVQNSVVTAALNGKADTGDLPTKTSDLTNDGSDGTSTYVEADDLATVATSGSYNDLTNKPTIPAAQVNSDWDAVSGVAQILNKPSLAAVATSGSYNDLSNKPTIGNATLTIQKNGTSAGTFTANATSNKTINITVPTTAADVSALPASTKYGASIAVSINTTDYKVTTTLKDQDGNTLGTAQVIDLPLESVVVNGSYDNTNKKIVLTLQNGNTIDIPVADLVAGLQTEITSSNKLASDLVDDTNQTHKFMTSAEKTKLSGIATGAEVNQNAFSNVKVGSTTVAADTKTDTLELVAGSNVTLTPDATNDKVTIAATDTTYSDATTSASGLMSAADKTKLNGIATGAEVNVQSDWNVSDSTSDAFIKNKPTIPTVNNGTLTIQKNGTTVQTFTANQSTNATANIAVPTKTSDITNDSGFVTGSITKANSGTLGTTTINSTTANYMEVTRLSTATDLNTIKTTGVYIITATPTNSPTGSWGTMYVDWTTGTKYQIYVNDGTSGNIFKRSWNSSNSTWTSWVRITSADIGNIERFYRGLVPLGTAIAANKNLNTTEFLKVGKYYCSTNATVATLTNCPTSTAFMMEVFSPLSTTIDNETTGTWVYRMRVITELDGDMWYQGCNSNGTANNWTYGAWRRVANTGDIGNATLTIQKNGTNVQTFTANATSNKTANITVPTKTSELSNDSNFVTSGSLATVATSGSYNDLSNKPTIPTVNNGTLTIQKNGTTVNTFTANSSNNVTANIPVPTLSTTNTDPGEGSALAADTFLGVYDIAPTAIDGSRITNGTVTTNKLASGAVTAAKVDFSTFGVAATVNGPSSTTSRSNGATWASTDMYTGSVTLAAGTYLVVVTGSSVAFSAGGEQEWFNITIDSTVVINSSLAWFSGATVSGNGVGIATIGTSGTHTVAYQLGAQGARTCTLYGGSKIQFVRIG